MMPGVINASLTDPTQQRKIFAYLEQMKRDPNGWQICAQAISDSRVNDINEEYLYLQVIEHYLRNSYPSADSQAQTTIKQLMAVYLNRVKTQHTHPAYAKNKWALLFALVFVSDFPNNWPQFFADVFLSGLDTMDAVEFYLRFLIALDSEVADREIQRTKEEMDRNTVIKDSMRELCITDLVNSWAAILHQTSTQSPKLACLCLNVIGAFVAWIEVSLIVNDRFVPQIVSALKNNDTQEAACDCVCSILSKGMEPNIKVQLVQAMDNVLLESGVYNVNEDSDIDDWIKVSELVNCIGTVLLECWHKWTKSGHPSQSAQTLMESKLNLMLLCLAHPDNDVSGSVAEFSHQYVLMLKQCAPLNDGQKLFVKQLLLTVMSKYRLPDDYSHETEGENEALFMEYRKEIKLIFINIGLLDADLMVNGVVELVTTTLNNWRNMNFRDIELALAMIYFIGEVVPTNQGSLFTSKEEKAIKLKNMLQLMITSGVSEQRHIGVVLEFFENVCRYDKLLSIETALVPQVLPAFLDDRGLRHVSKRVRSRSAYLFSRFVKTQKSVLQDYVEEILSKLEHLLAVSPQTTQERLISAEDQFFLFEATGTLVVFGNFEPEKKKMYMEHLVGSLVQKFLEGLNALGTLTQPQDRKLMTDFLNNIMAYTSRTTKAFSNQISMQSCMCSDIFLQLMTTFLSAVSAENAVLLDGLRQYLHRMVICLEAELLPYLSGIIHKFMGVASDLKSLQDFLILVQQVISKHKTAIIPHLHNDLCPLLQCIWSTINSPRDLTDETISRDVMYLRRAYFQLINAMVANGALELLTVNGEQVLDAILDSIIICAMDSEDPVTQRQCFGVIQKCAHSIKSSPDHQVWFDRFMLEKATPACLRAPVQKDFDLTDAQSLLVVHEIANCLRRFYEYKGDHFVQYLVSNYLNTVPQPTSQQLVAALKATENKALQKYLKVFFGNLKST